MEHLSRQVGHVAVHEDEKRLDDAGVGGEAWGEGRKEAIDNADENAAQRYDEEGDDSQEAVQHRHCAVEGKLLEKVVQNLQVDVKDVYDENKRKTFRSSATLYLEWVSIA